MTSTPTHLELRGGDVLVITWNDGQTFEYPARVLRNSCPCASCREKRNKPPEPASLLPVLAPEETQPLTIQDVQPVGGYAYSVQFSDGHNTGIYTLEHLHALGAQA